MFSTSLRMYCRTIGSVKMYGMSSAVSWNSRETAAATPCTPNDGDDGAIGVIATPVVNHGRMEASTYTPSLTSPASLDER
ncbi:MAG: hypothetical protein JWR13_5840 [Mycobacterium sp.]|jgi:hypothetical protein|nr:hypothetical protein [Mycobacterium sp.]